MRKTLTSCLVTLFMSISLAGAETDSDTPSVISELDIGDVAADFTLKSQSLEDVTLSEYRGQQVILAFYVFAFTGGWTKELQAFQENLTALEAANTQVLGVSMDSPFVNQAYAEKIGVTFPLLSDWGGAITRQYGLYVESYGAPRRVTYLIDEEGKISHIQKDSEAIDPAPILRAAIKD